MPEEQDVLLVKFLRSTRKVESQLTMVNVPVNDQDSLDELLQRSRRGHQANLFQKRAARRSFLVAGDEIDKRRQQAELG
jgi:hypothetical protein